MQTMRLLFVFGTRPEAIKLFPLIRAAFNEPGLTPLVCVSAQHRQMLDQVLRIADVRPDIDLDLMQPNQDLTSLTAAVLVGVGSAIEQLKPDLVVVQGDTTTAFASALAAFYRRIPVAHVEAGLRSGDLSAPWPEEANRRFISHIATHHFAPTRMAADNLLREGAPVDQIVITGNTGIDALLEIRRRLDADPALTGEIAAGLPAVDPEKRLVLVTAHRRENFDGGIEGICRALARLSDRGDVEIVFPVHPNPNVRAPVDAILAGRPGVHLLPPLDYLPFAYLMSRAALIITDSGGVQEEAPAFGVPVLVTRTVTERPEAVAFGSALLVGSDEDLIVAQASRLLDDAAAYERMSTAHNPFGDGQASGRIVARLSGRPVQPWGG
jgi:UDP-N-acetylglucosamine 2-epimerase (non-hydrolysing)